MKDLVEQDGADVGQQPRDQYEEGDSYEPILGQVAVRQVFLSVANYHRGDSDSDVFHQDEELVVKEDLERALPLVTVLVSGWQFK